MKVYEGALIYMTGFGDSAFKEVIKLNGGPQGGTLTQDNWYLCKKRERDARGVHREKDT